MKRKTLRGSLRNALLVGAAAGLASASACWQPGPARSQARAPITNGPTTPSTLTGASQRAPMVLSILGPEKVTPGQPVELKVVIERSVKGAPLFVKLALPPGTHLQEGQMSERIDDDADRIERTIVLRMIGKGPATDLEVSVDAGDQHFGMHATGAYRFGRAAPLLPQPDRTGEPLLMGGQDYGRPVPIGAQPDKLSRSDL
jgi:hypothetical protein